MERRAVLMLLAGSAAWPLLARAQNAAKSNQATNQQIGQVATLQGMATVTRTTLPVAALKISDAVFKNDLLRTEANSALGVTFDDETTFSLLANASIVINEFIYGGRQRQCCGVQYHTRHGCLRCEPGGQDR